MLDSSFGGGIGYVIHDGAAGLVNSGDWAYSVAQDAAWRTVVTGLSQVSGPDTAMIIWRYTSEGNLYTTFGGTGYVTHDGAAGGSEDDAGNSVVLDSAGRILVSGFSTNASGNYDMVIWRYE